MSLILQTSSGRYVGRWDGFDREVRTGEEIEFAGRVYKVEQVRWTSSGYQRLTVHLVGEVI